MWPFFTPLLSHPNNIVIISFKKTMSNQRRSQIDRHLSPDGEHKELDGVNSGGYLKNVVKSSMDRR
jgi:hypothetical protein